MNTQDRAPPSSDNRGVTVADPYQHAHVVTANAGFFVLTVHTDDRGEQLANAHPVIAWRVAEGNSHPAPVTVDILGYAVKAIELPNGRVIVQGGEMYANRTDWLAAQQPASKPGP